MKRAAFLACLSAIIPALAAAADAPRWAPKDFDALVEIVENVGAEGLDPARYPITEIEAARAAGDIATAERLASALFQTIAKDFSFGVTPEARRLRWRIAPSAADIFDVVTLLDTALKDHSVRATLAGLLPTNPQYEALKAAFASAAPDDAKTLLKIRANLERWRWMPRDLGSDFVFVNIPSQDLAVIRSGAEVDRRRIIYGARKTPTWAFVATITGVAFNPTWYVPSSIAASEGIHTLLRRRPAAAKSLGFYVAENGSVRQKPGAKNPLGRMKLVMPNRFSTYLHDTPGQALFARETRAFSHGCIRVEDALAFAQVLLEPNWSEEAVAEVVATGSSVIVDLDKPLPVYVAYFTAAADNGGEIALFSDVYGLDEILLRSELDAGIAFTTSAEADASCAS
ncbi:MAG: L,D-transpeptidase family protein [Parvularculaceae bacterium]